MNDLLRLNHLEYVDHYEKDGELFIKAQSKKAVPGKRCCLFPKLFRNGTKKMHFRDEQNRRQTVRIEIRRQQYGCKNCKGVTYEALPDIDDKHDMTRKLLRRIHQDTIERPFNDAANINAIDEKQAERIFKDHAARVLKGYVPRLPRVLGMDEISLQKKARFVIGDIESRAMLDMQNSRRLIDLRKYFSALPGRENVEVVCQDMWKDYRKITQEVFPNAKTVIDKFHVQRTANLAVEKLRRLFANDISARSRVRLKNKRKLFLGRWDDAEPWVRNQLLALFIEFPDLKMAYEIKEGYFEIYDAPTKADASAAMDKWLADLPRDFERPFTDSINALNNWRPWILNYWDHPYTNAYVEGLNKLIRKMNLQGSGYGLDVLRAKALLKHGTFKREPAESEEERKHTMRLRYRRVGLGVPLSSWEADLDAGTF